MHRLIPGAVAAAIFGAMAAGATVVLLFLRAPEIAFEMDRDLPRVISGFSPVERHLDDTFAWTSERAAIRLPDIDRFSSWRCVVRLRGGRPDHVPQPVVTIAADGVTLGRFAAVNEYRDFEVTVPVRPSPGLLLSITSSPTFVPGPSDQRSLGVQIDRLTCEPAAGSHPFPPWKVIGSAALAGAAFGAALFLLGLGLGGSLAGSTLFAMATAIPLATPPAAYDAVYLERATTLAIWISLLMLAPARVLRSGVVGPCRPPRASSSPSRAGRSFSNWPHSFTRRKRRWTRCSMPTGSRRCSAASDFFTQPLRDGVSFPYAIGLYVASMPWSALTRDHVALLRIVVCAAAAIAAALIYPLVVTTWNDRRTAATAVVLCHFVPLPFVVFGNGNLTFAFGAAVTLAAVAPAAAFPVSGAGVIAIAVLFALTSLALLSHVGIVPFLIGLLVSTAVLYLVARRTVARLCVRASSSPRPCWRRCVRSACPTAASVRSTTASAGRWESRPPIPRRTPKVRRPARTKRRKHAARRRCPSVRGRQARRASRCVRTAFRSSVSRFLASGPH